MSNFRSNFQLVILILGVKNLLFLLFPFLPKKDLQRVALKRCPDVEKKVAYALIGN